MMKLFRRTQIAVFALLFLTLGVSLSAQENNGTSTSQTSQRNDATLYFATNATSNTTLTINGVSQRYLYITQISITNCAGAAVTGAAPLSITSTGLGSGTTPVWTVGTAGTAGMCNPVEGYWGSTPLKSNSPGSNVTFVLPTFTTNQVIRINVWYYTST